MKMKKPELEVKRFDSEDVIATSGTPVEPVYLILSNLGNSNSSDNTVSVKNGAYDGQYVKEGDFSNPRAAWNRELNLANNAFAGVTTLNRYTQFWRDDKVGYISFSDINGLFRNDTSGLSRYNGNYVFDEEWNWFVQVGQTN